MKRGHNPRVSKLIRIAAKAEELRHEYFPNGGESVMNGNRLRLAAKHYVTAETCRDPIVAQRATRCAEFLLSKIALQEKPSPTLKECWWGLTSDIPPRSPLSAAGRRSS